MTNKPHYSFDDVKGITCDSISFSFGYDENDRISIEFNYTDRRDGVLYHVAASGWRSRVIPEAPQ